MGYYSEVALAMYDKDVLRLVQEASECCPYVIEILQDSVVYNAGDGRMIFHWSEIKWYGNYVEYIERFLNTCEWSMSRIGEESGDVSQLGSGDDGLEGLLFVQCYIELDSCSEQYEGDYILEKLKLVDSEDESETDDEELSSIIMGGDQEPKLQTEMTSETNTEVVNPKDMQKIISHINNEFTDAIN